MNFYYLKKKMDEYNEFYTYKKNRKSIRSISTLIAEYRIKNEYDLIVNEFEFETEDNEM